MKRKRRAKKRILCMFIIGTMLFQTIGIRAWSGDSSVLEPRTVMAKQLSYEEADSDRLLETENINEEETMTDNSEEIPETNTTQKNQQDEETEYTETSEETAVDFDTEEASTETENSETEKNSTEPDVEYVETDTHETLPDEIYNLLNDDGNIAYDEIDESYGHIIWAIDSKGKLTVSGNGNYSPFLGYAAPWQNYAEQITSAIVNVTGITYTTGMFYGCKNMTNVNLKGLDTSNVTDMSLMFYECSALRSLDLSNFNTNNVTNMFLMFGGCERLNSLDVSNFNTSNVTSMGAMFNRCLELSSLDVSNFNTSNVENMEYMFCWTALNNLDVSNFNTSSVTNMSYMFSCCTALTSLNLSKFDTSNVARMEHMFANCGSLTDLNINRFNTCNVTNMSSMFEGCARLTKLDVSHFNTKNTVNMCNMFSCCYSLESLDLSSFDMSNTLTTVDEYNPASQMLNMLEHCNSLTLLNTPVNCSVTVNLPVVQDTDMWFTADSVPMDTLPNTPVSMTLHKGRSDILVTEHPQNCEGTYHDTLNFTVDADGENLNYQWQVSEDNGVTWYDLSKSFSGYNQKLLKINALEAANGYEYRCHIWNDMTSTVSDTGKLSIQNSDKITITSQPVDYIGDELGTADFSVTATGNAIAYQWQVSEAPGKAWDNLSYSTVGFNNEALRITFLRPKEGFRYRCVITDKNKELAVSNAAKITFGFANTIKIISQPTYQKESINEVIFKIEAEGEDLVYQWQVSKDGGSSWIDLSYSTVGFNKDTMKITVSELDKGYQYRCKLSDKYDNIVFSDIAVPKEKDETAKELSIYASDTMVTMGTTVIIYAEVEPTQAWTESSSIIYTSSDTDIAEISDTSGKDCAVLAKAPGKVTITAALVGTKLTATCELTIKGKFNDDLQNELLNEIGTLYFFEGIDKTLADIKLPANWSWTDSSMIPLADNALPVQLFQVMYTKKGYDPYYTKIPVNVTKPEHIEIVGNDTVQSGEENRYQYICHYTGCDLPYDSTTQQWSLGSNMEFVKCTADDKEISIKTVQDDTLSLKANIVNPTTQATAELSASFAIQVSKLKIIPMEDQPANAVTAYSVSGSAISIDAATQYDKKEHFTLALKALGENGTVIWTSSDTSLMTVDTNGLISIKKAGIATITARTDTAQGELLIKVIDYTPILDNKSVTVNIYAANPVPIGLIPQNGNSITKVTLTGAQNGTLTAFQSDGIWCIRASAYKTGGKEKISLTAVTENGTYDNIALDVFVDVSRPDKNTFKIKQTVKPNIFYCGQEAMDAEFTVTSTKYTIKSITSENNMDPYIVKSYNPATGKLILTPSDTSKNKMKNYGTNMAVTLTVKTAELSGNFAIPLNVGTQNKKPKLRLGDAVFTTGTTISSVNLYNGKEAESTTGISFHIIKAPVNDTIKISSSKGMAEIYLNGGTNGSYNVELSKNTWTSNLTASGKVSKISAQNLVLEASLSKVILNTKKEYNEPVMISAAIKGNPNITIEELKAKPLKKGITATVKGRRITINANPNITGTVKLELTGKVNGIEIKKAVVPITLINKTPDIKLSSKGSINIANRSNSSIVYTPSIKNLPSSLMVENITLVSAMLEGDSTNYKDCFEAVFKNHKIELNAVSGKKLKPDVKYTLRFDAVLDNAAIISTQTTVKLKNTLPKVTVTAINKNLYKTNSDTIAIYKLSVGNEYIISRVNFVKSNAKDKNTEYFNVQYNNGNIIISQKNNGKKLKTGDYNLACDIIIQDADINKPIRVSFKITIK